MLAAALGFVPLLRSWRVLMLLVQLALLAGTVYLGQHSRRLATDAVALAETRTAALRDAEAELDTCASILAAHYLKHHPDAVVELPAPDGDDTEPTL